MSCRSRKPLLLDCFSGAGGCARGYQLAGFRVVGVDVKPQPRYCGEEFIQNDALWLLDVLTRGGSICPTESTRYWLRDFAVIHASPPCQRYSAVNRRQHLQGREYPDLIGPTRRFLEKSGQPWILENVEAAPLKGAVRLCGTAFDLPIRRHRLFESSHLLFGTDCLHGRFREKKYPTCFQEKGTVRRKSSVVQVYGNTAGCGLWPAALGIDWMNRHEMTQAIPPVFCEYLGRQLIAQLGGVGTDARP